MTYTINGVDFELRRPSMTRLRDVVRISDADPYAAGAYRVIASIEAPTFKTQRPARDPETGRPPSIAALCEYADACMDEIGEMTGCGMPEYVELANAVKALLESGPETVAKN